MRSTLSVRRGSRSAHGRPAWHAQRSLLMFRSRFDRVVLHDRWARRRLARSSGGPWWHSCTRWSAVLPAGSVAGRRWSTGWRHSQQWVSSRYTMALTRSHGRPLRPLPRTVESSACPTCWPWPACWALRWRLVWRYTPSPPAIPGGVVHLSPGRWGQVESVSLSSSASRTTVSVPAGGRQSSWSHVSGSGSGPASMGVELPLGWTLAVLDRAVGHGHLLRRLLARMTTRMSSTMTPNSAKATSRQPARSST